MLNDIHQDRGGCNKLLSLSPGYAVTAGHFSSPNVIDIAAGAPQHSSSGKVVLSSSFSAIRSPFVSVAEVILFFCFFRFIFLKLMVHLWWRVFKPQGKWYEHECVVPVCLRNHWLFQTHCSNCFVARNTLFEKERSTLATNYSRGGGGNVFHSE